MKRLWDAGRVQRVWSEASHRWHGQMARLTLQPVETAKVVGVATGTSMLGFAVTRWACTAGLFGLRVSSSNLVAATVAGGLTVCIAGNVAAHAWLHSAAWAAQQYGRRDWPLHTVSPSSPTFLPLSAAFAGLSLLQFRLQGGRLRRLAPSDVMRAGSFFRQSIPAPGNDYASASIKRALNEHGLHDGCHSCGRSRKWIIGPPLSFIGDHIPPNKYAKQADIASGAVDTPGMPRGLWSRLWPFRPQKTPQVFLPQCESCSLKQSHAVRMDKRTMVSGGGMRGTCRRSSLQETVAHAPGLLTSLALSSSFCQIFPRSFRFYDVWLPFPLLLALLLLPFLDELDRLVELEHYAAERQLGLTVSPFAPLPNSSAVAKPTEKKKGGWF